MNISKSSLGNGKEARVVLANGFKRRGGLKVYIQLPRYDDSQRYDLGAAEILSKIARQIYANSHNPSWETLQRHLLMAEIPKELLAISSMLRKMIKK